MTPSIHEFLDELYEIDPQLREHEGELIPLIEQLLKHDPGRSPDATFVETLRRQLQERAAELSSGGRSSSFFSFFTMSKLPYALGGAALAVLITVPTVYYGSRSPAFQTTEDGSASTKLFTYSVQDTKENAFGPLSGLEPGVASGRGGGGAQGGGGGGALPTAPAADPVAANQESGTQAESIVLDAAAPAAQTSKRIAIAPDETSIPEFTEYNYVYNGAFPVLPEKTVSVLQRQKDLDRPTLDRVENAFNVGAIDLGSFNGSRVDSITFVQEGDMGYYVSLALRDGTINVSQNWEKWPHPEQDCRDEACYRRFQLSPSDIPADTLLIGIAEGFVKNHDIDVSNHGKPEVDALWRREYERAADKQYAYVPEIQQVLYPLLVEGKEVYDQGGTKAGIRIGVSVRHKRVSEAWGIQSQNYLRSDYEAVTGSSAVLTYLSEFEQIPKDAFPPNAKVKKVQVTLDAPTVGYSVYYDYSKPMGQELIVPSLIFPIKNVDGDPYFWRQNVSVPLAQEMLIRSNPIAIPFIEKSAE